jgi:hypothetical protein
MTHAVLEQATGVPQVPVLLQVCTLLPEHWVEFGTHIPVHAPPTHAWFVHATAAPQVPLLLQV